MKINFVGESKRSIGPPVWAALLLIAVFAAGFLVGRLSPPHNRREADRGQVTVNPTKREKKAADLNVTAQLSGQGGSFFPAPRDTGGPDAAPTAVTNWFKPGDTQRQAFSGEMQARFVEDGSGKPLGEGKFPIQGETKATFSDTGLRIDTTFAGEPEIAVMLPKPAPKRYELGLLAGIDTDGHSLTGGYGRVNLADWQVGSVEIIPWAGMAGISNGGGVDGYLLVGIGGRF